MWLDLASIDKLKNSWLLQAFWNRNYYMIPYFMIVTYANKKEMVNK